MPNTPDQQPNPPGLIVADAIYRLDEIERRLKLGQHAMREARRAGLRVRRIGRRAYVLGRDLIEFVKDRDLGQTEAAQHVEQGAALIADMVAARCDGDQERESQAAQELQERFGLKHTFANEVSTSELQSSQGGRNE